MESEDFNFSFEENCVLQYLNLFPDQFITEVEIARRADSRQHFLEDAHWAHNALVELLEAELVETSGDGKYRLKYKGPRAADPARKFMDPRLRDILERSGCQIDLSRFT